MSRPLLQKLDTVALYEDKKNYWLRMKEKKLSVWITAIELYEAIRLKINSQKIKFKLNKSIKKSFFNEQKKL